MSDLPVRSIKGAFAAFLLVSRPPLLTEEGISVPKTFQKTPVPTPSLDLALNFVLEYRTLCVTFLHLSLY